MALIQGLSVSPGLGLGPVHVVRARLDAAPTWTLRSGEVNAEVQRLNEAIARVIDVLGVRQTEVAKAVGEQDAGILGVHQMILQDPGAREQVDRTRVVKEFKATSIDILFATDVAARGLDITDITHVINFDFPVQRGAGGIEDYVHRVGRTGRAGRKGSAITFFTREDGENAGDLVALLKKAKQVVSPALEALAATASSAEAVEAAAAKRQRKKDEKLSKKAIRSGDWRCKKCGSNVFATKDKCFKCKAPKPAE